MHRIDGAGNVAGMFVTEDPNLNRPPTEVTDTWLNAVQEEPAAVIEGVGMVLDKADNTQLRQAITKMIQSAQREVVIYGAIFAPAVTAGGQVVYWDSANSRFDLALADGSAKQAAVGVADLTNSAVVAFGDAVLFAGLTPGRYYLSSVTAGAMTAIAPASNIVSIGIARSATEMFVDIDMVPSSGLRPGTPLMWPTPSCPSWALVRDGSAISRSAYSALFAALCPTRNGSTTNGSNAITGLSSTADLYVGMPVEAAGVPAGATVSSITSSSAITISANATASATVPITLFYYGYGASGSSTTFGVPDDRGLTERGLDTGAASRDQSTITGTTTSSSVAITGLSSTVGLFVGMAISGTGVPAGATIAGITSSSAITISANATASGTVSLTVTGRQIGSYESDTMQGHYHGPKNGTYFYDDSGNTWSMPTGSGVSLDNTTGSPITDGTNGTPRTGPETRGKSRAYLPIIVY